MNEHEIPALFRRFAAPLAGYAATSPERKQLAEMLARNLWTAMIAGPEMEDEVWQAFRSVGQMDDKSIEPIQELYIEKMKTVVTAEQIAFLRMRYLKK